MRIRKDYNLKICIRIPDATSELTCASFTYLHQVLVSLSRSSYCKPDQKNPTIMAGTPTVDPNPNPTSTAPSPVPASSTLTLLRVKRKRTDEPLDALGTHSFFHRLKILLEHTAERAFQTCLQQSSICRPRSRATDCSDSPRRSKVVKPSLPITRTLSDCRQVSLFAFFLFFSITITHVLRVPIIYSLARPSCVP